MEVRDSNLQARILQAVREWAAPRYGEKIKAAFPEHATVHRTSSDSEADYIVSLDILEGPAPLRVKVFVAPDGGLRISD
jgi:hypothetical protein